MSDTFEELRIIAKDARGMDKIDRDVLRRAADELEDTWRKLAATQADLIESQAKRIALTEQIISFNMKELGLVPNTQASIIRSITWGNFNVIPMVPIPTEAK